MAKATREAFGEALVELAEKFPALTVLDADLSHSVMTAAFAEKFPERHWQFGIAESNMIGAAAGLALCGKIPVCASFACFLAGRLETIRAAVMLNGANVKLVGTHAGLGIGEDGASQMGLEDIGALRSLPGLAILEPADALETRQAVEWMLGHQGPVYLRLGRQKVEEIHKPDYRFELSKPDVLWEPDPKPAHFQATILVSGALAGQALSAAKGLLEKGFSIRVVNASTLAPFDADALETFAKDSERLVAVEDHSIVGGLASAVCEAAATLGLGIPVVSLGARSFGESGTTAELYERHGLSAFHIMDACLRGVK